MNKNFNLLVLVTIISSITLGSCKKDENNDLNNKCNVSNPAEELDWLKEAIDDVKEDEYAYYAMATYKGKTVFYYGNCNPAANYASTVKNCSGENLGHTDDLYDELTDITILWKHVDSKCNFQQ
ncbi:hypothetical protein D1164_22680 [Mariniphaga sediminis]|jgi:hypothetical protein|uniref:Uncharacterized protein n=1 Tax=Mariniphaga sediminis TaxID=1628158 RepID=A0A399CSN4_9BACT|nr:hypothetical protein [Mariniphaga sediminis]RIH62889.1 hypothetical protein D1164_22680 [Mariniphaga sediminis]